MRQWSLKPSLHNMNTSAAAMRHPLLRTPSSRKSASERALQPRRRQMSALATAATQFMYWEIQLIVRMRLKLRPLLTLQPTLPLIVSCAARSSM